MDYPKRVEGRRGDPQEYVEFQCGPKQPTWIAQREGNAGWYCYEVWPGRNGAAATLAHYKDKDKAVALAKKKAQDWCPKRIRR